jgi:hypothetical protein
MRKLQLLERWKMYLMTFLFTLSSIVLYAQTTTIKGKIVDEKGEPLTGASVRVTGTSTGASADINGNFSLNAPTNAKSVTISFIGYVSVERPITAGTTNLGTIRLAANSKTLNDVVVVGYGTLRRQDVTGTVATVDAKVLQEIPASNFV